MLDQEKLVKFGRRPEVGFEIVSFEKIKFSENFQTAKTHGISEIDLT